jgi:hypothetical protein
MPSEFAEFHQLEENVDVLLRFLSTSVDELPKSFHPSCDYLKEDLEKTLTDLQTDQGMLWDNINEPIADDTNRRQKRDILSSLYVTKAKFINKLLTKVRKLYEDLKRQSDTQALAENLIAILVPIEEQYRPGRNVDIDAGIPSSEMAREQALSHSPIIDREKVEKLRDHQLKLNDLVIGYITSRRQWVLCDKVVSKLQEDKSENLKEIFEDAYWDEINDSIKDAHISMLENFPASLRSSGDNRPNKLGDFFNRFITAIEDAQREVETITFMLLNDANIDNDKIYQRLDRTIKYVDSAIRKAESIIDECVARANEKVPLINNIIDDIFREAPVSSNTSRSLTTIQRTLRSQDLQESTESSRTRERSGRSSDAQMTISRPT